jgi:hypothetical protein
MQGGKAYATIRANSKILLASMPAQHQPGGITTRITWLRQLSNVILS